MPIQEDKVRSAMMDLGIPEDQIDNLLIQYNQSVAAEQKEQMPVEQLLALEELKIKNQIDMATDPFTKAKLAARLISLNL